MGFFDRIFGTCFAAGLLISQAFAALLYFSIFALMLYTFGHIALHFLG